MTTDKKTRRHKVKYDLNWIRVTDDLPSLDERVLVWMKYENDDEFDWNESEMEEPSGFYIEPNSGMSWVMGSARNFEITHWARVPNPSSPH